MYASFALRSLVALSVLLSSSTTTNVFAFKSFQGMHARNESEYREVLKRAHLHAKRHGHEEMLKTLEERQDVDIFEQLSNLLSGSSGGTPSLPLGGGFVGPEWEGDIDLLGQHVFVPPGPDDQRGPCVGLNALANHNFIDHTGIVDFFEVFTAIHKILGLGVDLSLILCIMGTVWGGNPLELKFSIGGADPRVSAPLDGLLGVFGTPQGIDFTHNFVESDSSLTRLDLYQGNCWSLNIELFEKLYYSIPYGENFTFENRAKWASYRFYDSIASNPEFWYGPYTGPLARNTAILFSIRILSDWSSGSPILTHEMLLSWYGVFKTPNGLVANQGWERIPHTWKRIPDDYTLIALNDDLVQWVMWYPELSSVGGNTGTVNSFVGVNFANPGSAVTGLPDLLLSNHMICFALEMIKLGSPTITNNMFKTIFDLFGVTIQSLGCPQVRGLEVGGVPIRDWAQSQFPGARRGNWM